MRIIPEFLCAIARIAKNRRELPLRSSSPLRNRQSRHRACSKHFTTKPILVNSWNEASVQNADRQSSLTLPVIPVSPLYTVERLMTRVGLILKCTSIATAKNSGLPYPKVVENSRRTIRLPENQYVHHAGIQRVTRPNLSRASETDM